MNSNSDRNPEQGYQKAYGHLFFYWSKVRKMSVLNALIHTVYDMEKAGFNVEKLKAIIQKMKEGTYVSKRKGDKK